jgi:hypothetical protein
MVHFCRTTIETAGLDDVLATSQTLLEMATDGENRIREAVTALGRLPKQRQPEFGAPWEAVEPVDVLIALAIELLLPDNPAEGIDLLLQPLDPRLKAIAGVVELLDVIDMAVLLILDAGKPAREQLEIAVNSMLQLAQTRNVPVLTGRRRHMTTMNSADSPTF